MRCVARCWPWVGVAWWKDVSHVLGAVVGDFDTDVCLICREGRAESFLLTRGEPITRGAQEKPDVVEGIPLASAVTGRVLPGVTAYLTWVVPRRG